MSPYTPPSSSVINNHSYSAEQMIEALARILTRRQRLTESGYTVHPDELAAKVQHVLWFHHHITERAVAGGTMPSSFTLQLLHLLEAATEDQVTLIGRGFPEYAWLMQHVRRNGFWTLQRAVGIV